MIDSAATTANTPLTDELVCPIDGQPIKQEMLAEFHTCSQCNEVLYASELVSVANKQTQTDYLSRVYPEGYDLPITKFPSPLRLYIVGLFSRNSAA